MGPQRQITEKSLIPHFLLPLGSSFAKGPPLPYSQSSVSLHEENTWASWKRILSLFLLFHHETVLCPLESAVLSHISVSHPWQERFAPYKTHFPTHHLHWLWSGTVSIPPPLDLSDQLLANCLCNRAKSSTCTFQPWRWRQHVPPKYQYLSTRLHGIKTRKTVSWTITAVKTQELTLSKIRNLSNLRSFGSTDTFILRYQTW
jgi:hypothetical protein